jgi:Plastocyanin
MLHEIRVASLIALLAVLSALSYAGSSYTGSDYGPSSSSVTAPTASSAPADSQMSHVIPTATKQLETSGSDTPNANEVVIDNFSFKPALLNVKAGTKVTWINHDDEPHTATDDDKRFNSKTLDTNDQFSFTFTEPGTYNYYCALHPKMRGQIVVK